ncbi:hypothetical protein EUZ93_04205 [Wolbachia pipientis]|nr:hypothetical protein [Wolbachia pipientis]
MWEKIKKFFKWIADHTGISWVARKVKSGLKWLFGGKASATQQNTSQQEKSSGNERQEPAQAQSKSTTIPKTLDGEVNPDQSIPPAAPDEPQRPVINTSETDAKELPENFPTPNPKNADSDVLKGASNENYLKVEETPNSKELKRESSTINVFNRGLELRLADDIQQKLEDYKNPKNNSKYHIKIHCNKSDFNIHFSKKDKDDGSVSLLINGLQKIGNEKVLNSINKIKRSLGFEKSSTFVVIDSIQKYQPSAKPDGQAQGSDNESNQSSFDNEHVEGATKGVDNSQPGASANDSTSNSNSSSFENVGFSELPENKEDSLGSPETNGRRDDTGETFYDFDEKLDEQLEVDGAKEKEPTTSFTAPSVQAAGNDKTSNKL